MRVYNEINGCLGGNSRFDKNGEPYMISVYDNILGLRHNIKFNSRYEFLNALQVFQSDQCKNFKVGCHSNTDSTNVDRNNMIWE